MIGILIILNLSVGSISTVFFGYCGEFLAKYIQRKRIFLITNLLWIGGYGALYLSPNFTFFTVMIILGAVGTGAFIPIGFSMVGELFSPKERGSKFGLMQFGLIFGNGFGLIAGMIFGNLFGQYGWRMGYFLVLILGLVSIVGYAILGIEPVRGRAEPELQEIHEEIKYHYRISGSQLSIVMRNKTVAGVLISVFCTGIAISVLANWGILHLTLSLNNSSLAVIIYIVAGCGALPGSIIGGKIGDKLYRSAKKKGRIIVSMVGIIIGASFLTGLYFIHISWLFTLILGFTGYFFSYFSFGNQFAIYSEVCVPEIRGFINSLNGMLTNVGGIIGNLMVTVFLVANNSNISVSILAVLLIWLISSSFWLIPYLSYLSDRSVKEQMMFIRRNEIHY